MIAASAALLAGCGALEPMPATEASSFLTRFAAGNAPSDVCTREGRVALRRAVRGYGAEMAANGVVWPAFDAEANRPAGRSSMDISVLIALAAGFIERTDLVGEARKSAEQIARAHLIDIFNLRGAVRVACQEVAEVQRTAAVYMTELARQEQLDARLERGGVSEGAWRAAGRNRERVRRAENQMRLALLAVQARVDARD
jgi:hypothetical protein